MDSNHRPLGYQPSALTSCATDRFSQKAFCSIPTRQRMLPIPDALAGLPAGGDEGNRTLDPLLAGQVLSQLSYTPI